MIILKVAKKPGLDPLSRRYIFPKSPVGQFDPISRLRVKEGTCFNLNQ